MAEKLVLSIDCSTTAVKAIAWNQQGRAVAEGRATYTLHQPQPSWYEQDANDWWIGLCQALKECISQIEATQVEALCVTNQRETIVLVDADGTPLRNAISWLDERSREQVEQISSIFGWDAFHRLTGKPPSVNVVPPKLLWLDQHEAGLLDRTHQFLDTHAFLIHRFTGHFRTSLPSADPIGLVDMENRVWATELFGELGIRANQFPELYEPGSIIGTVNRDAAVATGLTEGLPIIAGAGDGQSAGLGANAMSAGRVYLNLGTAVVSGAISETYLADRAFRTMMAPSPGHYYFEHVLKGGVFTVGWFVERFAADLSANAEPLSPEEQLEAAAAAVPPGALGLMLVPYWNNVMNPYWDSNASGITIGWNGAHGREHFYRAILEGIAFEQRLVGDLKMAALGEQFQEYITMGGGSRSPLWCQIMADVTGVPVVRAASTEATSLGAAILAATAAGWFPDVYEAAAHVTSTGQRFEPNPETQARYEPLYQDVYRHLYSTLQPLTERLTELTHSLIP